MTAAVVEVLILKLKPGKGGDFHQTYTTAALPLVQKWGFNVLQHGPSLHDPDTYYVIRSFLSLDQRNGLEDAFYSSDEWRNGPRTAILELVETYVPVVLAAESLKSLPLP